jgi:hypothetical protein
VDAVKFLVRLERPILPANHVAGAPLPERLLLEVGEYTIDARDRSAVVEQFAAAQAAGYEHLHGRTIRSITPLVNGS